jgi:hypothetical protein
VLVFQGKLDEALEAYKQARDIDEWFAKQDPSDSAWQRDLSVSLDRVGDVLKSQDKLRLRCFAQVSPSSLKHLQN